MANQRAVEVARDLDLANRHAAEISEDAEKQLKDKDEPIGILRREVADMKYKETTIMKPLGTCEEKCRLLKDTYDRYKE